MGNNVRKRSGLKSVARTTALGVASIALVGGAVAQNAGTAVAEDEQGQGQSWSELRKAPWTPERMKFEVDQSKPSVTPGERARVSVNWDLWQVWEGFIDEDGNFDVDLFFDVFKVGSWETAELTLDGKSCKTYGAEQAEKSGTTFLEGEGGSSVNYSILDIGGLVGQVRNTVESLLMDNTPLNLIDEALDNKFGSSLRAVCEFTVPKNPGSVINVGGNVTMNNLFGLLSTDKKGMAYLDVDYPEAPSKPTIDGGHRLKLEKGGTISGTADPGTIIQFKREGELQSKPSVKADKNGNWTLPVPGWMEVGEPFTLTVTSQNPNGGPRSESNTVIATVNDGKGEGDQSDFTVKQSNVTYVEHKNRHTVDVSINSNEPIAFDAKELVFTLPTSGVEFTGVATAKWNDGRVRNLETQLNRNGRATLTVMNPIKGGKRQNPNQVTLTLVFKVTDPKNTDPYLDWGLQIGDRQYDLEGGVTTRVP